MSLNLKPLDVVSVIDPRVDLHTQHKYWTVLKGGKTITYTPLTTTNISTSSITYNIKPPSVHTFLAKNVYHQVPVRLTLNCAVPNANNLIRPNFDAPRFMPISQSLSTLQLALNGTSVNIDLGDVLSALVHYNCDERLRCHEWSPAPSTLDQSQEYNDVSGFIRNPLSSYADNYGDTTGNRGGFPFTVVSNTPSQAVIDFVSTEPIFLNPFYFSKIIDNLGGTGLIGLNNMDMQFTFIANSWTRMWSHNALGALAPGAISSGSVQFNNFSGPAFSYVGIVSAPQLLLEFISPSDLQLLPDLFEYDYVRTTRYPFDQTGSLNANSPFSYNSQNITLHSIPQAIYVFVRNTNNQLQTNCTFTDTFASITKISCNWNNVSGIFSQASQVDLYNLSVANGCMLTWNQWSGGPVYSAGSFSTQIGTIGSIIKLCPALNFGLSPTEAEGLVGNYQFQIQVQGFNANQTTAIFPSLYIVVLENGVLNLKSGFAQT